MIELSNERMEQLLHKEAPKKEEQGTILRAVYTRYMRLYERYFSDIDALNDETIAELRQYNEETRSLVRYYYMDIPQDTCAGLKEFEKQYSSCLLGPDWRQYLTDCYREFKKNAKKQYKNEEALKAEFVKEALSSFYDAMDYVFRDGFGTASQTASSVISGITGLLFGKSQK